MYQLLELWSLPLALFLASALAVWWAYRSRAMTRAQHSPASPPPALGHSLASSSLPQEPHTRRPPLPRFPSIKTQSHPPEQEG